MKPLAVLSLILLAVGALIFALVSVLGGGDGRGALVEPVLPAQPAAESSDPDGLAVPAEQQLDATPVPRKELPQVTEEGRPATGHIRGVVVGPDGIPLERAQIGLMQGDGGSEFSETLAVFQNTPLLPPKKQASTDSQGRFRFDGLSPDHHWWLKVAHPLFAEEREPVDLPEEGGTEVLVTLQYGLALQGVVRDVQTRAPIPGATVALANLIEAFQFPPRPISVRIEVQSDAEGRFQFSNLGMGEKVLIVSARGYGTQMHPNISAQIREGIPTEPEVWRRNRTRQMNEFQAQPKAPVEIEIDLEPGKKIAGRVLGPDRVGVQGVQIQAVSYSGEKSSMGLVVSAAGGEFLIEDLAEGIYTVHAWIAGYDCEPLQRVEAGQTDAEIVLALQGSVFGRVVDDETGQPVDDFTCRVRTFHPQNITWGSVVAKQGFHDRSNGSFSLTGIPQSNTDYVVEAFAEGYASSFSDPFQVIQGVETQNVEVRLTRGGTIKGRVVDSYTGQGVSGAIVKTNENNYLDSEILQIFNAMAQTASTKTSIRTGENGEFELELLTPDRYQVEVDVPGYSPMIINDVNVPDGPATDLGDLRLVKGAIIQGIVYGPQGETIAGANIVLMPADTDMWSGRSGRTDANGHYTLRNAKSGAYKLYATRPAGIVSNPFAGAVDMAQSTTEIVISDGQTYEFDLHLPPRN